MRKGNRALIDMTPLLDVVFILLFALIINVNVTRAEDASQVQEALMQQEALEVEVETLEEKLQESQRLRDSSEEAYEAAVASLEAELDAQGSSAGDKQAIIDAYEHSLSETLDRQVELYEDAIPMEWLVTPEEEKVLLEEWLKHQQIAERYLFVELRISEDGGRVYLEEEYAGVNLTVDDLRKPQQRQDKISELGVFIFDWLDHKEGGYGFIFVTVAAPSDTTRGVVETAFDTLQGLQTSFERDQYLINRYVRYTD